MQGATLKAISVEYKFKIILRSEVVTWLVDDYYFPTCMNLLNMRAGGLLAREFEFSISITEMCPFER